MENLGDFFNEETRHFFAQNNIRKGSVIKVFVKNTNPPKEKRCLILGIDASGNVIGTVLINTEINWNVHRTIELASLQYFIRREDNAEILEWDSYVDCSELFEFNYTEVKASISKNPAQLLGDIQITDLSEIEKLVKASPKIAPKKLKKFGLI